MRSSRAVFLLLVIAKVLEFAARSFKQHGFRDIALLGDSGGNQSAQQSVAGLRATSAGANESSIMQEHHPTQSFSIRAAADADAGSIATLISQLGYPTLEFEMTERLARLRHDANYRTLVAETGSSVVGIAGVGLAPYYERNGVYGRLLVLAVDEKWRGKGIGRALVGAAEQWAISHGATAILVNSAHHRRDAHEFYERAGYRSTGVRFVKKLEPAI